MGKVLDVDSDPIIKALVCWPVKTENYCYCIKVTKGTGCKMRFRIVMTKSYRVTEVLAELNSGDKVDDGGRWKSERLEISIERPRIL